ncbi:MAG: ABC transporter ATP-binding protein [Candidatus Tectomicrobia bacterium]|uniref:ABC transporter ATP-binding protein n=1 Tax=Tectimicrobiota bacterium TaxID=2528274 RepID=A0A932CR93_UNCTE|nr:ABC transporter ATP-binding protein [Candidatus Tectomicrobia bacterium]
MTTQRKLQVTGVYKSFPAPRGRTIEVVRDLNFIVEDHLESGTGRDTGELFVLLGPSGCGKSTVLRMVAGLISPDRGAITMDGAPIQGTGRDRGMVFQAYTSFDWMTVLHNVAYGLKLQGVPKKERERIARQMVQEVGLGGFEEAYPLKLSGGQKQRVAIARTLAAQPKMVLMDEPFGALDAQTRMEMQRILLEVWDRRAMTILFVTHDIGEALLLGDRILVMGPRPTTVVEEIRVPFARPRDPKIRRSAAFIEMEEHLLALIGR